MIGYFVGLHTICIRVARPVPQFLKVMLRPVNGVQRFDPDDEEDLVHLFRDMDMHGNHDGHVCYREFARAWAWDGGELQGALGTAGIGASK